MKKDKIKGATTEPHIPYQNPAKRSIQDIKLGTKVLLEMTGANGKVWFKAVQNYYYLASH